MLLLWVELWKSFFDFCSGFNPVQPHIFREALGIQVDGSANLFRPSQEKGLWIMVVQTTACQSQLVQLKDCISDVMRSNADVPVRTISIREEEDHMGVLESFKEKHSQLNISKTKEELVDPWWSGKPPTSITIQTKGIKDGWLKEVLGSMH